MHASREDGFTLVEVLIAMLVFVFGIMAIANLFTLATSSNVVARHLTAATAQANEAMEVLKAVPFAGLLPGSATSAGDVSSAAFTTGTPPVSNENRTLQVDLDGDHVVDSYAADRDVKGVGRILVRWEILRIDNQTRVIRVVAQDSSPVLRGRTRVELVTYRSCTGPRLGCPATP